MRISDSLLNVGLVALVAASGWHLYGAAKRTGPGQVGQYYRVPESPRRGAALPTFIRDHIGSSKALVLVTASTCAKSAQSLGLYRSLSARVTEDEQWRFVVVGDVRDQDLEGWLASEGVVAHDVIRVNTYDEGLWGTPILMVTDATGVVTDIATSVLTPSQERQLWDRLDGVTQAAPLETFIARYAQRSELRGGKTSPLQIVDLRSRDEYEVEHDDAALNIPDNELRIRAPFELSQDRPVALECSRVLIGTCYIAAQELHAVGFSSVTILPPVPVRSPSRIQQ